MSGYVATPADMAFCEAEAADANDFTLAQLMQNVSDEYLAVLAYDHAGPESASFKAMVDAEYLRRSTHQAQRANKVALLSLAIAAAALVVAIGDAIF